MGNAQSDRALRRTAERAGIALRYTDSTGTMRETNPETLAACLRAMGQERRDPGMVPAGYRVIEPGVPVNLQGPWILTREDGTTSEGRGAVPGLPLGRHRIEVDGRVIWLLAAPPRLPLPQKGWGVTVPLYGLRTEDEGGVGTYLDLAAAAVGLGHAGASFLGINPVHAGFPGEPGLASPYSPSHRRRLSVAHIETAGEPRTRSGPLIDYEESGRARMRALETAFAVSGKDSDFDAYRAREGHDLTRFAIYEALAERHGPTWDRWPSALKDPGSPEVETFAAEEEARVSFHAWLQCRADRQLSQAADAALGAGMCHGLYLDLAVGTHPYGAETWDDRESFAYGVALGAPPDGFSPEGQNWSLAPFNPRTLIDTGFSALADTLRAQLRHAGMLRIDHILGFERAFWVPEDGAPGTYVTMPKDAMLAVARIEAVRAGGAVIVGEDLGNIPKGLAEDLAASRILGCDVVQFSPERDPGAYRETALASFGTHDLPTWRGWRAGRDIELRRDLGALNEMAAEAALAARREDAASLGCDTCDDMHTVLGSCNARLVALQIEDILEIEDQPNLPGTVDSYPNWRRRLPIPAASLGEDTRIAGAARIMEAAGRARVGSGAAARAGV